MVTLGVGKGGMGIGATGVGKLKCQTEVLGRWKAVVGAGLSWQMPDVPFPFQKHLTYAHCS
jgi:hypothetical protein